MSTNDSAKGKKAPGKGPANKSDAAKRVAVHSYSKTAKGQKGRVSGIENGTKGVLPAVAVVDAGEGAGQTADEGAHLEALIAGGYAEEAARWREWLLHRLGGMLPVWRGGVGVEQHVERAVHRQLHVAPVRDQRIGAAPDGREDLV